MSDSAYVVFAHGSSIESANAAVRAVASEMARLGQLEHVVAAFLGGGEPDLSGAIRELASHDGIERIVVVPYFLTLGLHLQRDLPRLIEEARRGFPRVNIEVTAPLDGHPAMAAALLDRARNQFVCKQN